MANRNIRRSKKNNKVNKEVVEEENDIRSFIKTVCIVLISFSLCCFLFLLLEKVGMFQKGYEAPSKGETKFTYNTAIIGTVFNRPESEYYVAFTEEESNEYFNTVLDLYKGQLPIYKVNMSLGINSAYKKVEGNPKASNSSELSIVVPTLIRIKNGKIVKYIEDETKIKEELSK